MKLYLRAGRAELACPDAHRHAQFVWQEGSEHVEHHQAELTCTCGKSLVYVGGPDPWAQPFIEVEGEPHGA